MNKKQKDMKEKIDKAFFKHTITRRHKITSWNELILAANINCQKLFVNCRKVKNVSCGATLIHSHEYIKFQIEDWEKLSGWKTEKILREDFEDNIFEREIFSQHELFDEIVEIVGIEK